MGRYNPFSFKGNIGRAQFWLSTILAQLVALPAGILPVSVYEVRLNPPHSLGQETVYYATPLDPTPENCAYLALFYALIIAAFWITFAAIVRRMRDLNRSLKWLFGVIAVFVLHTLLEALFSRPDAPFSVFEIANFVLMIPAIAVGTYGMIEMYFIRGNSLMRQLSSGVLRETQP